MSSSNFARWLDDNSQDILGFEQDARVSKCTGLLVEVNGFTAPLNSLCDIKTTDGKSISAEVVGFDETKCTLMPLGEMTGIHANAVVSRQPNSNADMLPAPEMLLGRVVDAQCKPIDGLGSLELSQRLTGFNAINPMQRAPISDVLDVGVGSINSLLTVGIGQRLGLFAGSGVGKSVLLGMLARFVHADVIVIGLIGERGREVQEFIQENLGEGLVRSVVIASPADDSAALRLRGARLATSIAESFRTQGKSVLLLMDSLTRVAQAQREIGLSMGEPASSKGYTPSSFACLPKLVERSGRGASRADGSITAFYTVLMEEDDLQDPIVDACRAILDGHIVLSRDMADAGIFPAIDITNSVSRVIQNIADEEHIQLAQRFRRLWTKYRENEDLISIGAYQRGSHPVTDEAIDLYDEMCAYLEQGMTTRCTRSEALQRLSQLMTPRQTQQSTVVAPGG